MYRQGPHLGGHLSLVKSCFLSHPAGSLPSAGLHQPLSRTQTSKGSHLQTFRDKLEHKGQARPGCRGLGTVPSDAARSTGAQAASGPAQHSSGWVA